MRTITNDAPKLPNAPRQCRIDRRRAIAGLVLLGALGATIGLCADSLKYRFIAKRFGVVVPGLIYRSGQISPAMIEPTLTRYGIKAILNLQNADPSDAHQIAEVAAAERLGIEYYRVPLSGDGTGEPEEYAEAIEILNRCHQSGKPVLVHCAAGAERTGGVVATYRLYVERKSTEAVIAEMRQYGTSMGADSDLLAWLNVNLGEIARLLQERGVIKQLPSSVPKLKT